MQAIKHQLDEPTAQDPPQDTVEQRAALLDELMEIVEHIDHARDLQTIGGLPTLLALVQDPEPLLRAKAAEVVATCAQNNPPVQAVRTCEHSGCAATHIRSQYINNGMRFFLPSFISVFISFVVFFTGHTSQPVDAQGRRDPPPLHAAARR